MLVRSQDGTRFVVLSQGTFLAITEQNDGTWVVMANSLSCESKSKGLSLGFYRLRETALYVVNEIFIALGSDTAKVKYFMPSDYDAELMMRMDMEKYGGQVMNPQGQQQQPQ